MTTRTNTTTSARKRATKAERSRAAIVAEIAELQAELKGKYQQLDALTAALMETTEAGTPIELPDGRRFQIVDQFANKSLAWKSVKFDRFKIEQL